MKVFVGALFSIVMISSIAEAKNNSGTAQKFERTAYEISTYPEKFEEVDLSLEDVDSATLRQLHVMAEKETTLWSDSILEGDYQLSDDALALNAVSAIYDGQGDFVAYRIIYSVRAWDIGACDFDWDRLAGAKGQQLDEVLKNCTEGHITGNSFVSPDLKKSERDYNNIEYFD